MGVKVQTNTLVPNGTACAVDACVVAVVLFHRDVVVEGWGDPWAGEFGLGVLCLYCNVAVWSSFIEI